MPTASSDSPPGKLELKSSADLATIERAMAGLAPEPVAPAGRLEVKASFDGRSSYFKEQWLGMAVAQALDSGREVQLTCWGQQGEPDLADDDGFALSLPVMLALQRGAPVVTEGTAARALDPAAVRRQIWEERQGLLGRGGRLRRLVEFDPESPVAPVLQRSPLRQQTFHSLVKTSLAALEVGSIGRGTFTTEHGAKQSVLEFLYELHANGAEYARVGRGVRMLRMEKHLAANRRAASARAASFPELADYIERQPAGGTLNLVEASVSDFGPGILDSFLASFTGSAHRGRDPAEVLDELLHGQLSEKDDPGAGLGIPNALLAARRMYGFVSLRTGEHWMTLDGSLPDQTTLRHRPGHHPKVRGTHWQLIYPDLTRPSATDRHRAPL